MQYVWYETMYLCELLIAMNEGTVSKKLMTVVLDLLQNPVFFVCFTSLCFSVFLSFSFQ